MIGTLQPLGLLSLPSSFWLLLQRPLVASLVLFLLLVGSSVEAATSSFTNDNGGSANSNNNNNNVNNNNHNIRRRRRDSSSNASSTTTTTASLHHRPPFFMGTDEELVAANQVIQQQRKLQRHHHQQRRLRSLQSSSNNNILLDPSTIPKYVTELVIPPVLYDDQGKPCNFEIALRQFQQQILPPTLYNRTTVWGYGNPSNPNTFHHPSFTMEVTRNTRTTITWRNQLLVNPVRCYAAKNKFSPTAKSCNYVPHVLQDRFGTPLIDATLHWAAPNRLCHNGLNKTDCEGPDTTPYTGPIPMVAHVHGAHTESRSDGYPESWFLPKANNIPKGYATEGTYFRSRFLPTTPKIPPDDNTTYYTNVLRGDRFFANATNAARGQGYAVYRYTNDQDTTTLWYHDHALGITRLNVYAAGAGFWLIRTNTNRETGLAGRDVKGKLQYLPGPPALLGQDPNTNLTVRRLIREIPLAIQDKSFYADGRLYYPANRLFSDLPECDDISFGGTFAKSSSSSSTIFTPKSGVSPIWNPAVLFNTMVVNGRTYPRLTVAPERYRFRLLNACDSRTLNLHFHIGVPKGQELPMYVIGSDQGLLPQVIKLQTGYATPITPGVPIEDGNETLAHNPFAALVIGPGERYDIIVDFTDILDSTDVFLINTGPDYVFAGFDEENYEPADDDTTGQIMRLTVSSTYANPAGDKSTSPYDLVLTTKPTVQPSTSSTNVTFRDVTMFETASLYCVEQYNPGQDNPCALRVTSCANGVGDPLTGYSSLSFGRRQILLGRDGRFGPAGLSTQKWSDPIQQNPGYQSTEIWDLWNWSADAHPIHLHLVHVRLLGRYNFAGQTLAPFAYETGQKDTILVLPGQITRILMTFDISGYFVWHCHMLSHEDNEMMLPFCVGTKGVDCPNSLFAKKK